MLVRVEVLLQDATVFIILNEETGPWPFRIENMSDADIVFYQLDPSSKHSGGGGGGRSGLLRERAVTRQLRAGHARATPPSAPTDTYSPRSRSFAGLASGSGDHGEPAAMDERYKLPRNKMMWYSWDYPSAKDKMLVLQVNGRRRQVDIKEIGLWCPSDTRAAIPQHDVAGRGCRGIDAGAEAVRKYNHVAQSVPSQRGSSQLLARRRRRRRQRRGSANEFEVVRRTRIEAMEEPCRVTRLWVL